MRIRVYIVDDHQLFIDGIKALLKKVEDIVVVGDAISGKDCLEELNGLKVDVLITDISMPEMQGDELVGHVKRLFPTLKVLTLSMHYDFKYIDRMIQVGALGYVLKNTGVKELREAIRCVNKGKTYYSPKVQDAIVNGYSKEKIKAFKALADSNSDIILTPREIEVLKFVVKGYSSTEIADVLDVSYHTITSHRKNINAKVGSSSLSDLSRIVREKNLY